MSADWDAGYDEAVAEYESIIDDLEADLAKMRQLLVDLSIRTGRTEMRELLDRLAEDDQ